MSRRHLAAGLSCLVLALLGGAPASATDAELLAGIAEIKAGDYSGGILTLDRVVRRLSTQEAALEDLGPAYLYLGIAHVALGREAVGRTKFQQAFVYALRAGISPDDVAIESTFPRPAIEVLDEVRKGAVRPEPVPRSVERPPAATPLPPTVKKGGSKMPLILGGVALAGGAAVIAASGGGNDAPGAAASAPTPAAPATGPPGITLLGLTPPSGSVHAGGCLSGSCLKELTVRYQAVSAIDLPRAKMLSEFFAGGRRCMFGEWPNEVDLIANRTQTFEQSFFVVECALPFTVTSLKAALYSLTQLPRTEQSFDITVTVAY